MFASKEEQEFFLSHIKPEHNVLEYGSGESTIEIAKLCAKLISMEHNIEWYNKIRNKLPSNAKIFQFNPLYPLEYLADGVYDQFRNYIQFPVRLALLFDIILIDGRARVGCASECVKLGHENTIVFIHDYDRPEYHLAENYLNKVEMVGTMAKFTIKF